MGENDALEAAYSAWLADFEEACGREPSQVERMAAYGRLAGEGNPADTQPAEHICPSHFGVRDVGTLRCLLVAPHPRYRHYAADPERPQSFWTWTDDQAATLGRYRVNDLVRYVGSDPRWAGQEGLVLEADYSRSVPLVVGLPGGPRRIGICFTDEQVEPVDPGSTPA